MAAPREPASVPAPLEQYTQAFDALFRTRIQRQRFRAYLAGVLTAHGRLGGTAPVEPGPGGPAPGRAA